MRRERRGREERVMEGRAEISGVGIRAEADGEGGRLKGPEEMREVSDE